MNGLLQEAYELNRQHLQVDMTNGPIVYRHTLDLMKIKMPSTSLVDGMQTELLWVCRVVLLPVKASNPSYDGSSRLIS